MTGPASTGINVAGTHKPWTESEHQRFLEGLEKHGNGMTGKEWQSIADFVGCGRSVQEVKVHAHKYFLRLQKEIVPSEDGWTPEDDTIFERGLAMYDEGLPNRWEKIAEMLRGKSADDVLRRYQKLLTDLAHIESGISPVPQYMDNYALASVQNMQISPNAMGGNTKKTTPETTEKRKGVPWTEDEHRAFLEGLQQFGRGDWRSISRHYVISRTPTQVASHAQKYFQRIQNSDKKEKRRPSIHDIALNNNQNNQNNQNTPNAPGNATPSSTDVYKTNPLPSPVPAAPVTPLTPHTPVNQGDSNEALGSATKRKREDHDVPF